MVSISGEEHTLCGYDGRLLQTSEISTSLVRANQICAVLNALWYHKVCGLNIIIVRKDNRDI